MVEIGTNVCGARAEASSEVVLGKGRVAVVASDDVLDDVSVRNMEFIYGSSVRSGRL